MAYITETITKEGDMDPETIWGLPAGPDLDALIAERRMGWVRLQAPQHDSHGPLPAQGEVLVSPAEAAAIGRGDYQWSPSGVIPFTYFLNEEYSKDPDAALRVLNTFPFWTMHHGENGYACYIPEGTGFGQGETFALAACRAVLVALWQESASTRSAEARA